MRVCEKCAAKRFSSKVRKTIQEAFDRQQAQLQRELWKRRMAVARRAMENYDEAKWLEALKGFREYVGILETRYSVSPGGLRPSLFQTEKEEGEILLLAGIYWDMAKVYDRMKSRESDMKMALNKFIEFSIDRKHLIVASEAMRRYIGSGKCIHEADFNAAHRLLRSRLTKCFIASAVFGPQSSEVATLRAFRDQVLLKNGAGRACTQAYYRISPPIAVMLVRAPFAQSLARKVLVPITKAIASFYKARLCRM